MSDQTKKTSHKITSEEGMAMLALDLLQSKDTTVRALGRVLRDIGAPFTRYMQQETSQRRTVDDVAERHNALCKMCSIILMGACSEVPRGLQEGYLDKLVAVQLDHMREGMERIAKGELAT